MILTRPKVFAQILLLLVLCACKQQQVNQDLKYYYEQNPTVWMYDTVFSGIDFFKIKFSVDNQTFDTTYITAQLKENTRIDGFVIKGGKGILMTKDFRPKEFQLGEDYRIGETVIPKNTFVVWSDTLELYYFKFLKDTLVQGFEVFGNASLWGYKGEPSSFYSSGALKCFYSKDDVTIGEIPCKARWHTIGLHPNGNLKRCKLAQKIIHNGKKYRKGIWIELDMDGEIINK